MKTTVAAIGNLLVFTLSNLAAPCSADDVGSTMAALKDAPSECRYYKTLCDDYLDAFDTLRSATDAGRVEPLASQRAIAKWREVQTAGKVLKAKHDTVPSCFSECPQKR